MNTKILSVIVALLGLASAQTSMTLVSCASNKTDAFCAAQTNLTTSYSCQNLNTYNTTNKTLTAAGQYCIPTEISGSGVNITATTTTAYTFTAAGTTTTATAATTCTVNANCSSTQCCATRTFQYSTMAAVNATAMVCESANSYNYNVYFGSTNGTKITYNTPCATSISTGGNGNGDGSGNGSGNGSGSSNASLVKYSFAVLAGLIALAFY